MKKWIFLGLCILVTGLFANWLVEVKVEGEVYKRNPSLEIALLLETIKKDIPTYDPDTNYLWTSPEHPEGYYRAELWQNLQHLVYSLLNNYHFNYVGIYSRYGVNGVSIIPIVFAERRFSPNDYTGIPENLMQYGFSLVANESIVAMAFNNGTGYFTGDIRKVVEKIVDPIYARNYQKAANVNGYLAYPLKNGNTSIGVLVVATSEPGLTEQQFFDIEQYADAATWLIYQSADMLMHPEKFTN
ncbi:MAG TPA: GAF domain-containing protein [Thermotogota bacterium]|jgi:hypothetical protein|nr:hypothetical protein [Thermotogota bacterium]NLH19862.1 hypothetical protein [Thermotogaceae bacterium]OQC31902.1 MAG: hypothetical protein BWX67_00791 [Thermotogota bacterium ADurb.Bin062]HNW47741.1 GAF domain-containing protein [Thermotogota bacterium]HOD91587.1 GAF domain-containing protein [Thermotogota bacterium]